MGSRMGSACKNVGAIRKPVISMVHSARKMCLKLGALMVQCGIVSHSCVPISSRADASRQQETCRAGVIPLKANGEQWTPRLRSCFRVRGKRLGVSVREVSPNRVLCLCLRLSLSTKERDSGFVQIVLNFFLILIGVHLVHGFEKTLTACPS